MRSLPRSSEIAGRRWKAQLQKSGIEDEEQIPGSACGVSLEAPQYILRYWKLADALRRSAGNSRFAQKLFCRTIPRQSSPEAKFRGPLPGWPPRGYTKTWPDVAGSARDLPSC
jgi:hypothetical protein